ncbi:unnamed protein product [Rangifer tarandus platyrhynchus]|uniref:Uncharacterized protein n=2 Tax=Rangifer tarandus platyrhynchus TaxID=3082113 RepID=A0ACB0FJA1_RANTA|nr:unnamed protein product [Rangifer tarandus platyrhynchus]CAI9713134.1 unnamed protein product [Rangifer tarandus platyrhynchus]
MSDVRGKTLPEAGAPCTDPSPGARAAPGAPGGRMSGLWPPPVRPRRPDHGARPRPSRRLCGCTADPGPP